MARSVEPTEVCWRRPKPASWLSACEHVHRVFGRSAISMRRLSEAPGSDDVIVITLRVGAEGTCEIICADGLLVGIPPRRSGEK